MFRNLSVRLASLFKRERLERELDTELRYHLDMLVEQNIARGMTPDAARRTARSACFTPSQTAPHRALAHLGARTSRPAATQYVLRRFKFVASARQ